jgi:hypothetical protein
MSADSTPSMSPTNESDASPFQDLQKFTNWDDAVTHLKKVFTTTWDVDDGDEGLLYHLEVPTKYEFKQPTCTFPSCVCPHDMQTQVEDLLETKSKRIVLVDNVDLVRYSYSTCNYCQKEQTKTYLYCRTCRADMCSLCYEKAKQLDTRTSTQDQQDDQPSNQQDDQPTRKKPRQEQEQEKQESKAKSSQACLAHNLEERHLPEEQRSCDVCHETTKGSWYKQGDFDMCLVCAKKEENQASLAQLTLVGMPSSGLYPTFGSLLDWVALCSSRASCYSEGSILVNANPNAKLFGSFALQITDGHGRVGLTLVEMTLEDLLASIEKHQTMFDSLPDDHKRYQYKDPIVRFACLDLGVKVDFG